MSRKKILMGIILVIGIVLFSNKTMAEEINLPEGFLISDDRGMTVTKNGGYFFQLDDLFPGDTITRKLTIQNKSNDNHTLKMYLEPVSNKGPADLMKNIEMSLTYEGQQIFGGNLVNQDKGVIDTGTEIDFGTIKAGSKRILDIQLKVTYDVPWEHFVKNESQAVTRWTFEAKRDKVENPKPTKPVVKPLPKTGEKKAIFLTILGIVGILVSIAIYYFYFYKDKSNKLNLDS